MAIIVLFALRADQEIGPDGVEPAVVAVHAAGSDPDVPEDPLPTTLCGLDTAPMEHAHYERTAPGQPWYPAALAEQRCRECDRALQSL
ncbi:hypothetical protein [Streptomyces sp. TLI_171]|uniref:hypothetical protein n=1 Tax=Streptomyces sp. TLI_171 TaxID=1938859 RepID=UPI000C18855F|nr:hypothetical protein [Streptomyces sp. TLI_171]RKE17265.1 hypothetical protein BX266_0521 [Streptomyces sp. TLI_171]